VASFFLATLSQAILQNQLTSSELASIRPVEASLLIVKRGSTTRGMAVLIDSTGLFIAHESVIKSSASLIQARTLKGKTIVLKILTTDDPTQLVLLQALDWNEDSAKPIKVSAEIQRAGQRVFAALPSGFTRAESSAVSKLGIVGVNRRLIPLNEYRLEAPEDQVGGALLFSAKGEFIGAVGAALKQTRLEISQQNIISANKSLSMGAANNNSFNRQGFRFGPNSLIVAYVVRTDFLNRVIEGFKSPTHEVIHPTIGLMCREYLGEGAVVDSVQSDSPAERAGLRKGDVILELANKVIKNQLDFAITMMNQQCGEVINVKILRNGKIATFQVVVGK
jgi:S1-C subfamily serine protease